MQATDIFIQARMDSSRLPGKIAKKIEGKAMLLWQIERLKRSQTARQIVILTDAASEEKISQMIKGLNIGLFVGDSENVLSRYYHAAEKYGSKLIVRATGDNPLTCPEFLDAMVETHLGKSADLSHFLGLPLGMGVEVISRQALSDAYSGATEKYDLEHVTPYLYRNRKLFKVLEAPVSGFDCGDMRVTVDTQEDLEKVRKIFAFCHGSDFISLTDVCRFFQKEYRLIHSA